MTLREAIEVTLGTTYSDKSESKRLQQNADEVAESLHATTLFHDYVMSETKQAIQVLIDGDGLRNLICAVIQSGFCLALEVERTRRSESSKAVVN